MDFSQTTVAKQNQFKLADHAFTLLLQIVASASNTSERNELRNGVTIMQDESTDVKASWTSILL